MSQRDPIGVFDSGIGGLTVVRELVRQLPHERIIYFGDTARVPYGPKSPDTVRRYSNEIATWLTQQHVKVIVVACNTATAHALEHLQRDFPLPVIGVVQPGARAAICACGLPLAGLFEALVPGVTEPVLRRVSAPLLLACCLLINTSILWVSVRYAGSSLYYNRRGPESLRPDLCWE